MHSTNKVVQNALNAVVANGVHVTGEKASGKVVTIEKAAVGGGWFRLEDEDGISVIAESKNENELRAWAKKNGYQVFNSVAANGISASSFSSALKANVNELVHAVTLAKKEIVERARVELSGLRGVGDGYKDRELAKDYAFVQGRSSDFAALCDGLTADLKAFRA